MYDVQYFRFNDTCFWFFRIVSIIADLPALCLAILRLLLLFTCRNLIMMQFNVSPCNFGSKIPVEVVLQELRWENACM